MLNWHCIYSVKGWRCTDTFIAELVDADPRKALQRLKDDDPVWSRGARLVKSEPVMKPRTPLGGIKFEWFGSPDFWLGRTR